MKISNAPFLVTLATIFGFCAALTGCASPPPATAHIVKVNMSDRNLPSVIGWAELEQIDAIHDLCYRYSYGRAAPLDYEQAFKWCSIAAENEISSSQVLLAELYWSGYGVSANKAKAVQLYKAAADNGHEHAQLILSHLYRDGDEVSVDRDLSYKYLRMSADAGYSKAIHEMKRYEPGYESRVESPLNDQTIEKNPNEIRMKADEGSFYQEFYRLTSGTHWKVKMRLHPPLTKGSPWAPLQSLCISSEGPSDFFCFVFIQADRNSDQLLGELRSISADQRTVIKQTPLEENFSLTQDVYVDLTNQCQGVLFRINGGSENFQRLKFEPQILRALCSTAECDFSLGIVSANRRN